MVDFFENLKTEIGNMVNYRIPMRAREGLTEDAYFSKRVRIETEIVKEEDFVSFWINCKWLTQPTIEDTDILRKLETEDLEEYHIVIFRSLMDMAKRDLEDTEQSKTLHEYYKLTRKELESRGTFLLKGDAYEEFIANKEQKVREENLLEEARRTGEICPHCQSNNVRSYGKQEWKCYACGKRFRKH
jgi:hypothetical protein